MPEKYSNDLVDCADVYFQTRYAKYFTHDQLVAILDALADVYEWGAGVAAGAALAAPPTAPDLITPHSC